MLEKFQQNKQAEEISSALSDINQQSANVIQIEREILAALVKGNKKSRWVSASIAPLAEPVNLSELVGDYLKDANTEIQRNLSRMDDLYHWLSDLNNVLKTEMEGVEKAVTESTDKVQDISIVVGDENRKYYWVIDSFNSTTFIDTSNTTALVDTDYGEVILAPINLQAIPFQVSVDHQVTVGFPGANLYILSNTFQNKTTNPTLEQSNTKDISALVDADPSTWFEIERNFIPPKQKLMMLDRAYVYSESGIETDVREVTRDYDWYVSVEWPDGKVYTGENGKGISLVEWINLDTANPVSLNSIGNAFGTKGDTAVRLSLNLSINPTPISSIRILPLLREDSNPILLEKLEAIIDGIAIPIAKNVELGTNKSTSHLEREILRRTGAQSVGSVYSVPSDRSVSSIKITLSSKPKLTKNGLAHLFRDDLSQIRTERNHGLWRSVDKRKEWGRKPYSDTTPWVISTLSRSGIIGTLVDIGTAAYALGNLNNAIYQDRTEKAASKNFKGASIQNVFDIASLVQKSLKDAQIGGSLGSIGNWLGRATPYVGALLTLDQLVGGLFNVKKDINVLESRTGYDVFKGHRASIALRDISITRTEYDTESVLQSVKREFPGLVSKIGLYADERIPSHWGPGNWLTYFVSTNGTDWIAIPKLTDTTLEKSLTLPEPTKTIYYKVVLKGTPSDPYHYPRLVHIALQGLPT